MRAPVGPVVLVAIASVGVALGAPPRHAAVTRPAPAPHLDPRSLPGWPLYDRYCLPCHGAAGDGRGPAAPYTWGRPRALASGELKWRSTPVGQPPTDDDLRTTLRYGAAGTSMPAFVDVLSSVELERVLDVVKAFAPRTFTQPTTPFKLGPPQPPNLSRGAYLWTQLGCDRCHGRRGRGNGPAAAGLAEPPYDLTRDPLRRPREADDLATRRRAAALSIATGLAGTPMPGYAGAVDDTDLWALADQVVAFGAHAARTDRSALDAGAIAADRTARLAIGIWPGTGDPEEARVFGAAIAPQGPPPAQLAPAQASLRHAQCGRCHAKQLREWRGSRHAAAASPGLLARLDPEGVPSAAAGDAASFASCRRCHTPLAEQQPGPGYDAALRDEGVTCAACHVRAWIRRGPARVAASLLPAPAYPLVQLALYERADFCLPCHQLPPRGAVAGKPLLNTYKEWLEGPYMRRGIECQHCHMPNREHTWLGVHDPATFRQGIRLDARAHRTGAEVTVLAELANVGAGHYLPTTPTPAAWLRIELLDAAGKPIDGARAELRIGRDLTYDAGGWHERADTRIPPGERVVMARAWTAGRTAEARTARITVEVHPDDYYERFYTARLAGKLSAGARRRFEEALARGRASHYIAERQDVPIALSSSR